MNTTDIPTPPKYKRCASCGLTKPLSEFGESRISSDGHKTKCKVCSAKSAKPAREGNPALAGFTDRELQEELRARGWAGSIKRIIEKEVKL